MDKLWYIQTMEYYAVLKEWDIQAWKDKEETYMHILKWKKSVWKGYIPYDSNIQNAGKGKSVETVKISVVPGAREVGGMNRWSTEDFKDNETIVLTVLSFTFKLIYGMIL